jgi:hypothetical protein
MRIQPTSMRAMENWMMENSPISVLALLQTAQAASWHVGPGTVCENSVYCREHGEVLARTRLDSWISFDNMLNRKELLCDCGRPLTKEVSRVILLT